ncbi:30S ribosomal protein S6 [Patescibacteria group bacterium]|nr:30S ribosomal protein S6 [Patescibacteria group bacterium]MBU1728028.1 30S ribosomal protein S6 [Patescibacteria group bacterium]
MENIDINDRIYEVGYLLVPTIPEEEVPGNHGNLKELIISYGGEIVSDEIPRRLNLAYTMSKVVQNVKSKFDTAYFGWVKFSMASDKILELKKKLDIDSNIIRFLLIKTVKENTIAAKRFISRDVTHKRVMFSKETELKESVPINEEEIDKEIDAMVEN